MASMHSIGYASTLLLLLLYCFPLCLLWPLISYELRLIHRYGNELKKNTPKSDATTRILLTGPRRAGKSSIEKVVFHKMSPNDTLFLESTTEIVRDDTSNNPLMQFQIWDFPGDIEFDDKSVDTDSIFKTAGALVFVIDAQDEFHESMLSLHTTVARCYEVNPAVRFEVFIHKVDGLSDDQKLAVQRAIQQQAMEELAQNKLDGIHLNFYLTSIYDNSVFEAFSKVIQKLIPQLPTLEHLLDMFISNCRMEKAFLIDVISKIYIATDSSPVDIQTYELCSDTIEVVMDVSFIYGFSIYDFSVFLIAKTKRCNGIVLYLREINKYLALVGILRNDKFDKQGLIDYNFEALKTAVTSVFEVPTSK